jgi:hypothetical protein
MFTDRRPELGGDNQAPFLSFSFKVAFEVFNGAGQHRDRQSLVLS